MSNGLAGGITDADRATVKAALAQQAESRRSDADRIENWFSYHAPTPEQVVQYTTIRDAAKAFAYVIVGNTPPSADQSAALRLLREAVMTANAAIACGGK